jgi:hypothetical protein
MSDFSELCPLFNTGMFNEVLFPDVHFTDVSACANALIATADAMESSEGNWTFGRTVIVTGAWFKKVSAVAELMQYNLMHHTSKLAAGTVFGTIQISITVTGQPLGRGYIPFTIATGATFASSDVLGLSPATVTNANGGRFDFIVRYKEK